MQVSAKGITATSQSNTRGFQVHQLPGDMESTENVIASFQLFNLEDNKWVLSLQVQGVSLKMELDTGSAVSLLSQGTILKGDVVENLSTTKIYKLGKSSCPWVLLQWR